MPRTTITRLAQACGVSTATVSRVFNNRDVVDVATRELVLKKALEMGYNPKLTARKDCIAIIVERYNQISSGGYDSMVIAALSEAIFKEGVRLEILPVSAAGVIREKFYLGIISCLYVDQSLELFRGIKKVAKVEINSIYKGNTSIVSDDAQGIGTAIGHLRSLGHRKIGFIGKDKENYNNSSRLSAFVTALDGHDAVEGISQLVGGSEKVLEAAARLVKEGVTAILCSSEELGPPVSHALSLLGKRIPDDISLVSFETQGISAYLNPAHTTISQDFTMIANAAVRALLGGAAQNIGAERMIKVPYTFIQRESTGVKR